MSKNFEQILFGEIEDFFYPLIETEGEFEALDTLSQKFGWNLELLISDKKSSFLTNISDILKALKKVRYYIDNPPKSLKAFSSAIKDIGVLKAAFKAMFDFDLSEFGHLGKAYIKDLNTYLFISYLRNNLPVTNSFFEFFKIIRYEYEETTKVNLDNVILKRAGIYPKLNLKNLSRAIIKPHEVFEKEYLRHGFKDWESTNKTAEDLYSGLSSLLSVLEFNYLFGVGDEYNEYDFENKESLKSLITFQRPLSSSNGEDGVGATIGLIPETEGGPGCFLIPYGAINLDFQFGNWILELTTKGTVSGFQITKEGFSTFDEDNASKVTVTSSLFRIPEEFEEVIFRFGNEPGTRIELATIGIKSKIHLERKSREFDVMASLGGFKLVIERGEGDGFLKKIIPKEGLTAYVDLLIGWSSVEGFHIQGSGGLEIIIPINKSLGTVNVHTAEIGLQFANSGISLKTGVSFSGNLGPVSFSIERVALNTKIGFSEDTGDLGPFNISAPEFHAPAGAGIAIDAKLISGGGFLKFDRDNHQYFGMLSLNMQGIELTGIALIATKLPNNKSGFSMLVTINVLFNPPIQLGFGYSLKGVGGVIGINRTMKVDVLRKQISSGIINSIMFPINPIKNSNKVINDLRNVFPSKEKHTIIAPFLRIGWGVGKIIEVDLGLFLEFPFKGRIILLGSLGIYLPDKRLPLTELHVDILGDFNFAKEYIRIEGVVRKSHIVGIALSGGFAFVLAWGRHPQFLISVGGYHPRYKKPDLFPAIKRLKAVIKLGGIVTLTCEYYNAISSNSFQIGFRADLFIKIWKFSIRGYFAFDALLQFDPFYFETCIEMGVNIKFGGWSFAGVNLSFLLSGPKPWTVQGRARIRICFFIKISIKFHKTWGGRQNARPSYIEPADLLERLELQLLRQENWTAHLPPRFTSAETLRSAKELKEERLVLIHPSGYLKVRQIAVPLNRKIEKLGNSIVKDSPRFHITSVQFGDESSEKELIRPWEYKVKEYFSRGQYKELSNAEKISSPDFELMPAGLSFDSIQDYDFKEIMESTDSGYENIVIKNDLSSIVQADNNLPQLLDWEENNLSLSGSARKIKRDEEPEESYRLIEETPTFEDEIQYYLLTNDGWNFPDGYDESNPFSSYSEAKSYCEDSLSSDWEKWQIVSVETYQLQMEPELV